MVETDTDTMVVDEDRVNALISSSLQQDSMQSRDNNEHEATEDVVNGTYAVSLSVVKHSVNNPTEETEFGNSTETYAEFDFVSVVQSLSQSQEGTYFIDSTKAKR